MPEWERSCSMESGQCGSEDGRTEPAHCSAPPSPFSWRSRDVRQPGQRKEGCAPPHWPNHCADTWEERCRRWMALLALAALRRGKGKPQLPLFLLISERFIFSASFIGLACGINIYVKYCKTLAVHFISVWILSLCVLLLRRNINIIMRLFNMAEYTHS